MTVPRVADLLCTCIRAHVHTLIYVHVYMCTLAYIVCENVSRRNCGGRSIVERNELLQALLFVLGGA